MSDHYPTLAELRSASQKARHREIGNWLARRFARPTAIYGTWAAIRLGMSAHKITFAALMMSLLGSLAIGAGSRLGFVSGVVMLHVGFWLDHVDGQVARWRKWASLDGVDFDYIMHHVVNLALGFSLGFGLAVRLGDPSWALAGFAIAAGWNLIGLHNDCRYKAFFQRLKSSSASYYVQGGAGGRPAPPAPWPRHGLGILTWPAYKACEPHVVLLGLTALALLASIRPSLWQTSWTVAVSVMAFLAPVLGAARVYRAIKRGSSEAEFNRWFRANAGADPYIERVFTISSYSPLDSRVSAGVSPNKVPD